MTDDQIHANIERLVAEEHELQRREGDGQGTDADRRRLDEIAVGLDRCWDLLRQRRALRSAGANPDDAEVRDAQTVEHYLQ
jgi:uncharacterized protein DUF2630